jgi:hypothetical protein
MVNWVSPKRLHLDVKTNLNKAYSPEICVCETISARQQKLSRSSFFGIRKWVFWASLPSVSCCNILLFSFPSWPLNAELAVVFVGCSQAWLQQGSSSSRQANQSEIESIPLLSLLSLLLLPTPPRTIGGLSTRVTKPKEREEDQGGE